MKIINIIEDSSVNDNLIAEHGLCFYIETEKHKLLIDTGASEATWKNASNLGIDLKAIDTVILSHGHYDHTGGVMSFVQKNSNAIIYIHKNAIYDYYNTKTGTEKYIGIDKSILNLNQLQLIESDLRIDNEISVFTGVTERINWPQSNLTLKRKIDGKLVQDNFSHEQYAVINSGNKSVLISGCAHNGIINILNRFKSIYGKDPDMVISGFHTNKATEFNPQDIAVIESIADKLSSMNTIFYTGHCTGEAAYKILANRMTNLYQIHSGLTITLGSQ